MTIVLLFVYLFGLYIRPQDWVPLVFNWPLDWIIYSILIACTPLKVQRVPALFSSVVFRLLVAWMAMILVSDLMHFEIAYAQAQFTNYVKLLVVFISFVLFLDSTSKIRAVVWEAQDVHSVP